MIKEFFKNWLAILAMLICGLLIVSLAVLILVGPLYYFMQPCWMTECSDLEFTKAFVLSIAWMVFLWTFSLALRKTLDEEDSE